MVKRVSFPAMGWGKIAFKALLEDIPGVEIVMPPDVNNETIQLGAKQSPEFVCHPFKVTLGEFIYMMEHHNVHTFVQAVDCGPCRLGFYAPVQERILKDMGYDVEIIPILQDDLLNFKWLETFYRLSTVEGKLMRMVDVVSGVRKFFLKSKYIEDVMKIEGILRAREIHKGDTTAAVKRIMERLDNEKDFFRLHQFDKVIKEEFRKVEIDREKRPLRIVMGGENHVFLESFVNMELMEKFGNEGVEVHPAQSLYDWIMHKLHVNYHRKMLERIAKPYFPMDIGGEAVWIMGAYIKAQRDGFDGFVHVYPFTCMPETAARGIIESQSPDPFYLPIQFYSFDEHTGYEGMRTRLESFIDLMNSNRANNPKFQHPYVEPPIISEIYDKPIKTNSLSSFFDALSAPLLDFLSGKPGYGAKQEQKTL